LAWLAKNPNTSTIILGVTSTTQLLQNLEALKVLPKITDDVLEEIEAVLGNKPTAFVSFFFFLTKNLARTSDRTHS
jgi:aryl-alcohol dehydrogenase-like predicted oxidoreductase